MGIKTKIVVSSKTIVLKLKISKIKWKRLIREILLLIYLLFSKNSDSLPLDKIQFVKINAQSIFYNLHL